MKRALTAAWLLFLASVPLWLADLYVLHVLIMTGIFIIAAMSLNLLLGYTGQLSLGHVAFFGIGAYISSLVSLGFEVHLLPDWLVSLEPKPVWLGMICGTLLAGMSGWVIGKVSFKVRGAYFVIVTVSFAEVVRLVALNWVELTQGPMALNNIPALRLGMPGLFELHFLRKPANYWLVLAVAVLCYVLIRRLVRSRAGRAMIALRENEPLATSVGVDVTQYLVLATMISAAMIRPRPLAFCSRVCVRTPSSTNASWARICDCWCEGKMSMMRLMVSAAEFVCRVANAKCPVSAIVNAASAGIMTPRAWYNIPSLPDISATSSK